MFTIKTIEDSVGCHACHFVANLCSPFPFFSTITFHVPPLQLHLTFCCFTAPSSKFSSLPRGAVIGGAFGSAADDAEFATLDELKLPHCPAFRQVGDVLGPFDLAVLPIGGYSPRWYAVRTPVAMCSFLMDFVVAFRCGM